MLLTFILVITSIPAPPHSFIPRLKPSFSANSSHPAFLFFFRTDCPDSPYCLPILLRVSIFYFLVFLFTTLLVGSMQ